MGYQFWEKFCQTIGSSPIVSLISCVSDRNNTMGQSALPVQDCTQVLTATGDISLQPHVMPHAPSTLL